MSRVFISYSRPDRAHAEALADDLKKRGNDVWWDFELYAGDAFHQEITAALDGCLAVVVIWSATAAKSIWVCAEAMRALRKRKLIPTRLPDFDTDGIPLPFDQFNTVLLHEREPIYRAVDRLLLSIPISFSTDLNAITNLGRMYGHREDPNLDLTTFHDFASELRVLVSPNHPITDDVSTLSSLTLRPISLDHFTAEYVIDLLTRIHSAIKSPLHRSNIEAIVAKVLKHEAHLQ
jgi:hypothetical protein